MNTISAKRALQLIAALVVSSCSRGPEKKSPDAAAMPAMTQADSHNSASDSVVIFSAAQVQHGNVAWQAAALSDAAGSAVLPGSIVPDEDHTARIGAPARARIMRVLVRPGDRVRRGQALAVLNSPEAGAAQADFEKARAELASRRAQAVYARSAQERAARLLALKAIPRQEYERAVADDELARAALTQGEAELRRAASTAQQLGVGSASGDIVITAPAPGVVLTRTAIPGMVVEAGAPIVAVTEPSRLWLLVNAPEQFTPLFRVGSSLQFSVRAYPQTPFTAVIEAVGPGLDPQSRTLPVRARVDNSKAALQPEMLATVTVRGGDPGRAVVLPADAVQLLHGKSVVFVASPQPKGAVRFVSRVVEADSPINGLVAVKLGLQPGELVVTRGAFAVKSQLDKSAMPKMEM
jgi:cobalt-zinc-cadmium efflux system membrane fusion protein